MLKKGNKQHIKIKPQLEKENTCPSCKQLYICLTFFLFTSGHFWHITDLHWDPSYGLGTENSASVCASSGDRPTPNAGKFGDYLCDSSWALINSSIHAMKDILSDPDFIVWTGYVCEKSNFKTKLNLRHRDSSKTTTTNKRYCACLLSDCL